MFSLFKKKDYGADFYNQAQASLQSGMSGAAAIFLAKAVNAEPGNPKFVREFADTVKDLQPTVLDPALKDALCTALASPHIHPQSLGNIWLRSLFVAPEFSQILALAEHTGFERFKQALYDIGEHQNITDPLFIAGLQNLVLTHLKYEQFLTSLRRSLQFPETIRKFTETKATTLAAALARYCFFTGYIFNTTDNELESVPHITCESGPLDIALYACYFPLCTLKDAAAIQERFTNDPVLGDMVRELIAEPLRQRELLQHIPTLMPVNDATSQAVQQQYNDFPYPCWRSPGGKPTLPEFLEEFQGTAPSILVAGCGTGREALYYSQAFPDARILAVDISPASLAFAIRRTQELGFENIEFKQADILSLPQALEEKFDIVACSGVLHHMKDPDIGFAALDQLLKPGGLMRIALYSRLARRHVSNVQKEIAARNYGNTATEIRRFRQDCPDLLSAEDMAGITRAADFFIMNQCRDLLFHVMEHQYDIPAISALLQKHGYEFLEFVLPESKTKQYKAAFSDKETSDPFKNWALFEQQHPNTFEAMYNFGCRKPQSV